jgi:serine/threonine-protein kinase
MTQPTWIGHELVGRYLIEDELGQGGMSAVYKATDSNLRRVVAVKIIHRHLSRDPQFVRRFEAEATAVAQFRHPNIVQVYDFDNEAENYFIVFEFVPGETLQARLERLSASERRLSLEETIKISNDISRQT